MAPPPAPVPGLFPAAGRVHLLGGSNHAGKSTLLAQICHSLLSGDPFFGYEVTRFTPSNLFVVFCDRTIEDNMQWMRKLPTQPTILSLVDDHDYMGKIKGSYFSYKKLSGYEQFRWLLDRLNPPRGSLILPDVFSNVFVGNDIQNQTETRSNMIAIASDCAELGITVLGTCYGVKIQEDKKTRYKRLIDRIIGSATFRGSASTVAYLTTPSEAGLDETLNAPENTQILEIVPRDDPETRLLIRRRSDGFFEQVSANTVRQTETVLKISCKDAVQTLLSSTPDARVPIATIYSNLNPPFSQGAIDKALQRLKEEGSAINPARGYYQATGLYEPVRSN